jgi:hypothetical protein
MDCESQGEKVYYHVSVFDIPKDVDALGFEVQYDPNILRYTGGSQRGDLVSGFDFFGINESNPGVIKVGGFTTDNPIQEGSSGELLTLEFTVNNSIDTQVSVANLVDDLAGIPASPGMFEGEMPAPIEDPIEEGEMPFPDSDRQTPPATLYTPEWLSPEEWQSQEYYYSKEQNEYASLRNQTEGGFNQRKSKKIAERKEKNYFTPIVSRRQRDGSNNPIQTDVQKGQHNLQPVNKTELTSAAKAYHQDAKLAPTISSKSKITSESEPSGSFIMFVTLLGAVAVFFITFIIKRQ